jgi:hypothetical protein
MAQHHPYWFIDKGTAEIGFVADATWADAAGRHVIEFEETATFEDTDGTISPIRRSDHGETMVDGHTTGGSTIIRVTMTGCYDSNGDDVTDEAIARFAANGRYSVVATHPRIVASNTAGRRMSERGMLFDITPYDDGEPTTDETRIRYIPQGVAVVQGSVENFNQNDQRGLALEIHALPVEETIDGVDYWVRWRTGVNS